MGLGSLPWFRFPMVITNKEPKFSLLKSLYNGSRLPSSSSTPSLYSNLFCLQKACNLVSWSSSSSSVEEKPCLVHCSKLKMEDDLLDAEGCELVSGSEVEIRYEGSNRAHLFKAVKNNNGAGILLLSDIFGFPDSFTKDFAYRVACNGYNVLVPDLFHGNPWSKDRPKTSFQQWLAEERYSCYAICRSTKWMVEEFMATGMPRKLGMIAFGHGGGKMLETLVEDDDSTFGTGVCFYGTKINIPYIFYGVYHYEHEKKPRSIKAPVLFINGDKDPLCPADLFHELEVKIGNGSKGVVFEGRGHGFAHRPQSPEDDTDAERAFMILRKWLDDKLLGKD